MMAWKSTPTMAAIETVHILIEGKESRVMVVMNLMIGVAVGNVNEAVESTLSVVVVTDRAVQTVLWREYWH